MTRSGWIFSLCSVENPKPACFSLIERAHKTDNLNWFLGISYIWHFFNGNLEPRNSCTSICVNSPRDQSYLADFLYWPGAEASSYKIDQSNWYRNHGLAALVVSQSGIELEPTGTYTCDARMTETPMYTKRTQKRILAVINGHIFHSLINRLWYINIIHLFI